MADMDLWERILDDRSLSREARLMAMHLLRLGAGEHPVSTEDWQRVLGKTARGFPKRQSIAVHVQELELGGWVSRRPGGAGSPRYALQSPQGTVAGSPVPGGDGRAQVAPVPSGDGSDSPVPSGDILQSPQGTVAAPTTTPTPATTSSAREDVEITDLHPMAGRVIVGEAETLGQAGAPLRDYLALRVEPSCQYGYARLVVGALTGLDETLWRDKMGESLTDDRTGVLREALNDLLACDEVGKYFNHEPGEYGNLRGKVSYIVNRRLGAARMAKKRREAPPSDRPDRSAAEEQADIEERREAARRRSEQRETQVQLESAERHREQLLAAKAWIDEQDEDMVASVNRRVEAALDDVPERMRTRQVAEATLIAIVMQERGTGASSGLRRVREAVG